MNTREVLARHHGIRYRIDEGWSCACGCVLPTSGTTPLTRQAKHDEAVQQWVSHLRPFLAADEDALLERVEAAEGDANGAAHRSLYWQTEAVRIEHEYVALAAKVAAVGERIAQAIEASCDAIAVQPCRPCRQAAHIARVAPTEGTEHE